MSASGMNARKLGLDGEFGLGCCYFGFLLTHKWTPPWQIRAAELALGYWGHRHGHAQDPFTAKSKRWLATVRADEERDDELRPTVMWGVTHSGSIPVERSRTRVAKEETGRVTEVRGSVGAAQRRVTSDRGPPEPVQVVHPHVFCWHDTLPKNYGSLGYDMDILTMH
jgi:hypothetical protein